MSDKDDLIYDEDDSVSIYSELSSPGIERKIQ